ncbi:MAG TPA: hypothetical protein VMR14_03060 [Streptosporangiaceae bacterium]|jgi:hypothetical protein|nr:hypothetical protein [Streptosporangiaceae bacterium]
MDEGLETSTPEEGQVAADAAGRDPNDGPMSLTGLASDRPALMFDRILQWIPRLLSSKPHVVLLLMLGVYLVVLPLFGIVVSAKSELIGGNYTNVTSDIGACIAAGGTLHLINQGRKRAKVDQERLRLLQDIHGLLHHVHSDAAADLGHVLPMMPMMPKPDQQPMPQPPATDAE